MFNRSVYLNAVALMIASLAATNAVAQLSVTGRAVSQLAWLDTEVLDLMNDNNIDGGMVAIMRNGKVIYQRGFGWKDSQQGLAMPENSLCRIASCTKPFTAAAIQQLADEGVISLEDFAFDLGQPGGGILNLSPFPSIGDQRLKDIKVRHLLNHTGGWNRDIAGDLTYMECTIAGDMGVTSPPGRTNTMRWILGQPLQCDPGDSCAYSNIGYLALGLIVEEVTGQELMTYLRQNILRAHDWVPASDFRMGSTFEGDAPIRESWYNGSLDWCVFQSECIFGCATLLANSAYGSWDHAARTGQGRIVLSPATMLRFLDRYKVQMFSSNIGEPLDGTHVNGSHNGALDGCNTLAWQRSDGINVFCFFNKDGTDHFGEALRDRIEDDLDNQASWPTLDVEGFWVDPAFGLPSEFGSYGLPHHSVAEAVSSHDDGSTLNLKAGSYTFTGTITTRLRIRAPLGSAHIGN